MDPHRAVFHSHAKLPDFSLLPKEVTAICFLFLPYRIIHRLGEVCQSWHQIVNSESFWKNYSLSHRMHGETWLRLRRAIASGQTSIKELGPCNRVEPLRSNEQGLFFQRTSNKEFLACWNLKENKYVGKIRKETSSSEIKDSFHRDQINVVAFQNGNINMYDNLKFCFTVAKKSSYIDKTLHGIHVLNNHIYLTFEDLNKGNFLTILRTPLTRSATLQKQQMAKGDLLLFKRKDLFAWMNHKTLTVVIEGKECSFNFSIRDRTLIELSRISDNSWLFIYKDGCIEWRDDEGEIKQTEKLTTSSKQEFVQIEHSLILKNSLLTSRKKWDGKNILVLTLWHLFPLQAKWSINIGDFENWQVIRNLLLTFHKNQQVKILDLFTGEECLTLSDIQINQAAHYVKGKIVLVSKHGKLISVQAIDQDQNKNKPQESGI